MEDHSTPPKKPLPDAVAPRSEQPTEGAALPPSSEAASASVPEPSVTELARAAKVGGNIEPPEVEVSRYFYWNLCWLALIVMGTFLWTMSFTNFFSSSKPFWLTVGVAAFSFIWSWLPKTFTDPLVELAQRGLFASKQAARVWPLAFLVLGMLSACWSTIELLPSADAFRLTLARDGEAGYEHELPSSGSTSRLVRCLLFHSNDFTVRVAGRPTQRFHLSPWRKRLVQVDQAYHRPTLLVLPTKDLIEQTRLNPKKLVVTVDKLQYTQEGYRGEAIWIGVEQGVEVPMWLRDRWWRGYPLIASDEETVTEETLRRTLDHWTRPMIPSAVPKDLAKGSVVTIELLNEDSDGGELYTKLAPVKLQLPLRKQEFPQTEKLDAPS